MTPKIITQTKILLRTDADQPNFSRLVAPVALVAPTGPELEDWADEDNQPSAGWDELDDENTKHMIREKRREQRMHQHQMQQQQKSAGRSGHTTFAQKKT